MVRSLLTVIVCVLCSKYCLAQHIQRKGSLGVGYYQKNPDSLVRQLSYKQGAIVQFVVPGTTAENIGVKTNDIITSINEAKVIAPGDLQVLAKALRADNTIVVAVVRNNESLKLKGKVVAKPKETSASADVVYGEFSYKKGYVRTILKSPKGGKISGVIYFLQGLPCYSMDNFKEGDITKRAIDAMVDRGFAVYRIEKGDMGDNVNMPACETMGFDEELNMYKAGYENLLSLKGLDTSKIFLFGHSMGGITAPLLAAQYQPKGVVVYGTVFKPWMDYLFDAYLMQLQYYGEDLSVLRDQVEVMKPYIYDYFYKNISIEKVCSTEEGKSAMSSLLSYDVNTGLAASGRSPLCHKELNEHNVAQAWKNTRGYVLAIYGECDIAAIHPDDHIALIKYVNSVHPGKGSFWLAPKTSHTFEEIGTMDEFIKLQSDPAAFSEIARTKFNYKVFDHVCDWMKEKLDR